MLSSPYGPLLRNLLVVLNPQNRFSYDTEVVDVVMTMKANSALISSGWTVTGFVVMVGCNQQQHYK